MPKLSQILKSRGYVHQFSSKKLEEITDGEKRVVYLGIDPTADSLHVGNLVGLLVLRRFLEDGHKIILLTGGGTGMIGDPSGKSDERNLLDEATIAHNTKAVVAQIRQVFGSDDFIEENNAKWLSKLSLLEFLRDVAKHFTVNSMIKKDIVAERLKKESPISFTEFSYSLLQGYDFLHLNEEYGCDVQVGGSDQWSNILSGVEFIRRKSGKEVYAFTWPLLINKSTGKKFGKSEAGAVWLDSEKTSVFQFYQFWLGAEDEAVEEYLLKMTMLSEIEISTAMELHRRNKKGRHAQKLLARTATTLVHGEKAMLAAERISEVLFGAMPLDELSSADRVELGHEAPTFKVEGGEKLVDVLVESGLASSKREARQFVTGKAISINQDVITDVDHEIDKDVFYNNLAILRRGARSACVLVLK